MKNIITKNITVQEIGSGYSREGNSYRVRMEVVAKVTLHEYIEVLALARALGISDGFSPLKEGTSHYFSNTFNDETGGTMKFVPNEAKYSGWYDVTLAWARTSYREEAGEEILHTLEQNVEAEIANIDNEIGRIRPFVAVIKMMMAASKAEKAERVGVKV